MQTTTRNTTDTTDRSPVTSRRRTLTALLIAALAVVAAVTWFLMRTAPADVSIEGAAAQIDDSTAVASGEIAGDWTVDTGVGTFSVEDTTGTFVGFRIAEVLASVGETEAVGRTPEVTGSMAIEGTTLVAAGFEADMTAIVSDVPRRDDNIQEALNTSVNPTASFVLTSPVDLGDGAATGEAFTVEATGALTVNAVTNTVTIPITAQLVDNVFVVTSSFDVVFADYDVQVPSSQAVLSVEDHGSIELQLFLTLV